MNSVVERVARNRRASSVGPLHGMIAAVAGMKIIGQREDLTKKDPTNLSHTHTPTSALEERPVSRRKQFENSP